MPFEPMAMEARALGKTYQLFDRPLDRLKQILWGRRRSFGREFVALQDVSFTLKRGEVLGLVGRNGAGKSTLLQLICGVLTPTHGTLAVHGRVAALLELGAGFNPEFTGRENVYLYGSVLGMSRADIDAHFADIVTFAGIERFIDQPVKSYSSGMYVRLAFSIATSAVPDVLVVDEALSVGDGEFARKSFDRIMALKAHGTTILFCSHAMYQIEAFCDRAIWLEAGRVVAEGAAQAVVADYSAFLETLDRPNVGANALTDTTTGAETPRQTRLLDAQLDVQARRMDGGVPVLRTGDTLGLTCRFVSDTRQAVPSFAITILNATETTVTSAGTFNDGLVLERDADGVTTVRLKLPKLPLLKGRYAVSLFLMSENGVLALDHRPRALHFVMEQEGVEQGLVTLEHHWE
jgi:lipopolysaccharide transport system ATP-binding protein